MNKVLKYIYFSITKVAKARFEGYYKAIRKVEKIILLVKLCLEYMCPTFNHSSDT